MADAEPGDSSEIDPVCGPLDLSHRCGPAPRWGWAQSASSATHWG